MGDNQLLPSLARSHLAVCPSELPKLPFRGNPNSGTYLVLTSYLPHRSIHTQPTTSHLSEEAGSSHAKATLSGRASSSVTKLLVQ